MKVIRSAPTGRNSNPRGRRSRMAGKTSSIADRGAPNTAVVTQSPADGDGRPMGRSLTNRCSIWEEGRRSAFIAFVPAN